MSLPFAVPPGTPADRLAALRKAFDLVHKDSDFLAEAGKSELDVSPIDGSAGAKLVADLSKASPELIAKFKKISTFSRP